MLQEDILSVYTIIVFIQLVIIQITHHVRSLKGL